MSTLLRKLRVLKFAGNELRGGLVENKVGGLLYLTKDNRCRFEIATTEIKLTLRRRALLLCLPEL